MNAAEEQVRAWLGSKLDRHRKGSARFDWDAPGHYEVARGVDLLVVHADHDDQSPRRLYRVVENNAGGRWIVSVYAGVVSSRRDHEQLIVVEVDLAGADRQTALAKVAPPRIVRALLDTYEASDGSVQLTGTPNVVRAHQVDEVIAAIADPDRTASVVVALSPARDLDNSWRQVVESLTRQSVGVSATYVVFFDAAEQFNGLLPRSHRVKSGQIRTFLPRVDLDNTEDAIRHKWLALPTLTRSLKSRRVAEPLQRRHGEDSRRRFVESELPADVQRMIELLRRAETGIARAARVEALVARTRADARDLTASSEESATPTGHSWQEKAVATLRRWLHIDRPQAEDVAKLDDFIEGKMAEIEVATEQLAEAASDVENLQAEVVHLRRERDDLELEWAVARESQQNTDRENGILRQRLAASPRPQDAYVEPDSDDWEPPSNVELLTQWLTPGDDAHHISSRVIFTGSVEGAIEIDRRYASGVYATAFWLHVRALHDYAVAYERGFNGNLHNYLNSATADGVKCPPGQHAARESETVLNNTRWRAERVFAVPEAVDPTGRKLMEAHFKPTWRDTFAPRLYYYDDLASTGKIYVGYIGRHLTNTQS